VQAALSSSSPQGTTSHQYLAFFNGALAKPILPPSSPPFFPLYPTTCPWARGECAALVSRTLPPSAVLFLSPAHSWPPPFLFFRPHHYPRAHPVRPQLCVKMQGDEAPLQPSVFFFFFFSLCSSPRLRKISISLVSIVLCFLLNGRFSEELSLRTSPPIPFLFSSFFFPPPSAILIADAGCPVRPMSRTQAGSSSCHIRSATNCSDRGLSPPVRLPTLFFDRDVTPREQMRGCENAV